MALSEKHAECAQCGMVCAPNEYHPYAACLMFMGCKDGAVVRANLSEVRKQDDALILQLVEAFEYVRNTPTYQYDAKTGHRLAKEALQAGRARLEGTPCD